MPARSIMVVRISRSSMPATGHAFGGGLDMRGAPDRLHQRFAMMRPRAANQRAVDVKKHKRVGLFQLSL